jgi:hypothetical protein
MAKKSKTKRWFKPVRGSYLPNNWIGWLTYVPFCAYLIVAFAAGWHYADHDALKATIFIVPNWVAAAAIMTWVAKRES